jgi:1-acyl-sn-glycerol-3-phosphate acyltransferase
MPRPRDQAVKKTSFRNKIVSQLAKIFISGFVTIFFRIRVTGKKNAPESGPFLLVSNHEHVIDPVSLQIYFKPWIHWVAKAELFRSGFLAVFLRLLGVVPFEREQLDMKAMRQIISLVRAGEVVGIFPHGKRIKKEERATAEPKAATAHLARRFDLPLVPVAIENGFKFFRRTRIYIGPMFRLEDLGGGTDLELTKKIMQRIYDLIPPEKRRS